jgi:hypothetical protein
MPLLLLTVRLLLVVLLLQNHDRQGSSFYVCVCVCVCVCVKGCALPAGARKDNNSSGAHPQDEGDAAKAAPGRNAVPRH